MNRGKRKNEGEKINRGKFHACAPLARMTTLQLAGAALALYHWRGVIVGAYTAARTARRIAIGARWSASLLASAAGGVHSGARMLVDAASTNEGVESASDEEEEWVVLDRDDDDDDADVIRNVT